MVLKEITTVFYELYKTKTQHFFNAEIRWLMVLKEITTVFYESYTEPINTFCGQNAELLIIKAGSTYT
jgi:hypothetical protein